MGGQAVHVASLPRKATVERMRERHRQRRLLQTMNTWRSSRAELARQRAIVHRTILHAQQRELASAFNTWRGAAQEVGVALQGRVWAWGVCRVLCGRKIAGL